MPDGDRRFASFGIKSFNTDNGSRIREYQIVQRQLETLNLALVMDTPYSAEQEKALISHVQAWVKHPFEIQVSYVESIPRSGAGKFEVFRSEIS